MRPIDAYWVKEKFIKALDTIAVQMSDAIMNGDEEVFKIGQSMHSAYATALTILSHAPTIEVAPMVHGYNNNQNYHAVDEFRCSECGLHLEGWERHVYDEDLEDEFIKEYEFKFCPECGADIRERKQVYGV